MTGKPTGTGESTIKRRGEQINSNPTHFRYLTKGGRCCTDPRQIGYDDD